MARSFPYLQRQLDLRATLQVMRRHRGFCRVGFDRERNRLYGQMATESGGRTSRAFEARALFGRIATAWPCGARYHPFRGLFWRLWCTQVAEICWREFEKRLSLIEAGISGRTQGGHGPASLLANVPAGKCGAKAVASILSGQHATLVACTIVMAINIIVVLSRCTL